MNVDKRSPAAARARRPAARSGSKRLRTPAPATSRALATAPSAPAAEDDVYDRIRGAILDHRLNPGTKLKEVALADVFGVNRSVVRKVLARLAFARLVDLTPNRGASVASPTVDESRDLFAARRAVEAAIVDAAARRIAPAQVRALRALVAQERDAYRQGDMRRGLKLSLKFHHELAQAAGNRVLAEFLDQLIARTPLVVLAYRSRGSQSRCGDEEHADILAAVGAGDAARAVAAMETHLRALEGQLDLSADAAPADDLAQLFAAAD